MRKRARDFYGAPKCSYWQNYWPSALRYEVLSAGVRRNGFIGHLASRDRMTLCGDSDGNATGGLSVSELSLAAAKGTGRRVGKRMGPVSLRERRGPNYLSALRGKAGREARESSAFKVLSQVPK